ncbi:MAG: cyclic nucleotide-binding/CBS domain-containing protein [Thermoplasmata archaeon]|jgi:CBS domain-containing protein
MKVLKVKDAMSDNFIEMDANASVKDAINKMIENQKYTVIVDEGGVPAGIITERDFVTKVLFKQRDIEKTSLKEVMNSPIIFVLEEDLLDYAAKLMSEKKIRKLPVLRDGKIIGILTENDIIKLAPLLILEAGKTFVDWKKEIVSWLTSGTEKTDDLLDLQWDVKIYKNEIVAEHPKVPFILHIIINQYTLRLEVYTGIETALLDVVQRLDISRKLLFLNDRITLAKFTIRGINEEIILTSELDLISFSKEELSDSLSGMVTAMFMMVRELKIEEEFNKQLAMRVIMMVRDRMSKGETKDDIINFLINKVGMDRENAEKLYDEIIQQEKGTDTSAYL